MAQVVKNLLETKETQIRSLGREDPLEKGMATHLSILSWRIPWTEEPGRLQSTRSKELDRTEQLTLFPECANLFLFSVLFFQSNLSLWNCPSSHTAKPDFIHRFHVRRNVQGIPNKFS